MTDPARLFDCFQDVIDGLDASSEEMRSRHRFVRGQGDRRMPVSPLVRALVYRRDGHTCQVCGALGGALELDHIVPWSAGGSDRTDNIRTLCAECNADRSNWRDGIAPRLRLGVVSDCGYCGAEDDDPSGWVPVFCGRCGLTSRDDELRVLMLNGMPERYWRALNSAREGRRCAVAATRWYWPAVPEHGMITFVDPGKTRRKRDPGRCFRRAGFRHVGFTKDRKLYVLQLAPEDMPAPSRPLLAPESMFEVPA